jgi:hypothetical protein
VNMITVSQLWGQVKVQVGNKIWQSIMRLRFGQMKAQMTTDVVNLVSDRAPSPVYTQMEQLNTQIRDQLWDQIHESN